MTVRVLFRCEQCDALPDPATERTLGGQLRDRTFGECQDAQPGGWLIWTAGGPLGSKRYACPQHRDDLIAYLRRHYGAIRCGVWKAEPYPALWPDGFSGSTSASSPSCSQATSRPRRGLPACPSLADRPAPVLPTDGQARSFPDRGDSPHRSNGFAR